LTGNCRSSSFIVGWSNGLSSMCIMVLPVAVSPCCNGQ
jgi:hypothetical protein